jgi:hypothetical protein
MILVGKPEETIKKTKMWVGDNIKMNLSEIGWGDMDWIDLAQDTEQLRALVKTVMNLRVHKMLGNS